MRKCPYIPQVNDFLEGRCLKPVALTLVVALLPLFGTACEKTISSMVSEVSPGVVRIVTPLTSGSGFIINEDGLVITNAHVVQIFKTVDVRLADGQSYQGEVLDVDEDSDLALLDLRASRDLRPVPLGDSDAVAEGEDVIAMGFPSGNIDVLLDSPTITRGVVSAKRVAGPGVKLLQTDAAINPGTSGRHRRRASSSSRPAARTPAGAQTVTLAPRRRLLAPPLTHVTTLGVMK